MSVVVLRKLVPLKNSQTNINLEVAWQVEIGGRTGDGGVVGFLCVFFVVVFFFFWGGGGGGGARGGGRGDGCLCL